MAPARDWLPGTRSSRVALALAPATAYAAVAVAKAPWTLYSSIFTAIPGLVALAYAVHRGWHRTRRPAPPVQMEALEVFGMMIWALLVAVLTVWVLAIFFSHPRSIYPTLSHLMNMWFENYAIRTGAFVGWLGLGWYLVRR